MNDSMERSYDVVARHIMPGQRLHIRTAGGHWADATADSFVERGYTFPRVWVLTNGHRVPWPLADIVRISSHATREVELQGTGRLTIPHVSVRRDHWAHGVWQALAVTLAEPLREAFGRHLDTHGCGCGRHGCVNPGHVEGHRLGGFGHCPEASRLFALLPDGDQVIVG